MYSSFHIAVYAKRSKNMTCRDLLSIRFMAADTFNCYNKYSDMGEFIVKLSKIHSGEIFALDFESVMYYFRK